MRLLRGSVGRARFVAAFAPPWPSLASCRESGARVCVCVSTRRWAAQPPEMGLVPALFPESGAHGRFHTKETASCGDV